MVYNIKSEKCNLEENGFLEAYLDNSATTVVSENVAKTAYDIWTQRWHSN